MVTGHPSSLKHKAGRCLRGQRGHDQWPQGRRQSHHASGQEESFQCVRELPKAEYGLAREHRTSENCKQGESTPTCTFLSTDFLWTSSNIPGTEQETRGSLPLRCRPEAPPRVFFPNEPKLGKERLTRDIGENPPRAVGRSWGQEAVLGPLCEGFHCSGAGRISGEG